MKNKELSDLFEKMADILEFKGENPFRINAYWKASRILGDLTRDVGEIASGGGLKDVPGIGQGLAEKIEEYLKTGRVSKFEEVKKGVPDELIAIMNIPGMGPKTLALLHKEKRIGSLSQLETALEDGSLIGLRLSIGTDAHHTDQMWMMSLGVAVARRGWLESGNVLNTLSLGEMLRWCHR